MPAESSHRPEELALRRYRDPSRLWIVGLAGAAWFGGLGVAFTHVSHGTTWWIVIPSLVVFLFLYVQWVYRSVKTGVFETQDGLIAYYNGWKGMTDSVVAWREIQSFGYTRFGARYIATARRHDGTVVVLWGASRRMRWHGGSTNVFAITLAERQRLFLRTEAEASSSLR